MAKKKVDGAPHDAGSAFEPEPFRGLPGQLSGAILSRRKNELEQRLSGLYREVKALPRCCEHCEFLAACTVNRIACATFAKWATGNVISVPEKMRRIATPEVYNFIFSGAEPKRPGRDLSQEVLDSGAEYKRLRGIAKDSIVSTWEAIHAPRNSP